MVIEHFTPSQRRALSTDYIHQASILNDLAVDFKIGAQILREVDFNTGIVRDVEIMGSIPDVLAALDQFQDDLNLCMFGSSDNLGMIYDPRQVIGVLLRKRSRNLGAISQEEQLQDHVITTKGTLVLVKHAVIVPPYYVENGANFLTVLNKLYKDQSQRSFIAANDVLWSTNPRVTT